MRYALSAAIVALVACGGDTGDPKVGECQDYCELVLRNCMGPLSQYGDVSACQASCEAMELGDPDRPTGNTIACRTFAAAAAELDPEGAGVCPGAGPGGYGTCGSPCESFCALAGEICTGDLAAYASDAECMSACAGFASAGIPFAFSIQTGDTFECRLYHLTAASAAPEVHCGHIAVNSSTCN